MIEVMMEQVPWRRKAKDEWELFLHNKWIPIEDHEEIRHLELGFKYGREYLRWQISQLSG